MEAIPEELKVDEFAARHGFRQSYTAADVDAIMPEAYDASMERYYVRDFGVSPEEAIQKVGINRWRVAATVQPYLADLLAHIEGYVRHT